MRAEELAEKAYGLMTEDDTEATSFDALPKPLKYEYCEIAAKGGDSSLFGSIVSRVLAEKRKAAEETATEDEVVIRENPEGEEAPLDNDPSESNQEETRADDSGDALLASEDETRAALKAKNVPELREIARGLEIDVPSDAREDEIIDFIISNVGTSDRMDDILKSEN